MFMDTRSYTATHPWITFTFDTTMLSPATWMRLGEAISKCDHIAGVPLKPAVAQELHMLFLVKGVHANTQIEGNTLSEEEVRERLAGRLRLPASQEHLGIEADNVAAACAQIFMASASGAELPLTVEHLSELNRTVLSRLPVSEDVEPGKVRTHSVLVGNIYRGVPAEDCQHLLERLCEWLRGFADGAPTEYQRPLLIIRAVLANLYFAWIHPFGDGNGRTARLIEFQLLLEAGLPTPACHLLSNYYNRTRQQYYRVLGETSRAPYPVDRFVAYALEGFVEELRDQLDKIRSQQLSVAWVNFVHDAHADGRNVTTSRRRDLVLALQGGRFTPISEIRRLTPILAELYAGKSDKTITRDVNALASEKLVEVTKEGVRPCFEQVLAFLPHRQLS